MEDHKQIRRTVNTNNGVTGVKSTKTKRRKTSDPRRTRRNTRRRSSGKHPRLSLTKAAPALFLITFVCAGIWGARRLESYVAAKPEYHSPPEFVLVDVPAGIEDRIQVLLAPFTNHAWSDPDLCRAVAENLAASPWVESIEYVRRFANGRISVSCQYRLPAALVQSGGKFYALSTDGVRLPGSYQYTPALVLVQGVNASTPPAGDFWTGDDLQAAIEIIELLHKEPFFDQVTAILVDNYGGRKNEHESHLQLVTSPGDHRIAWGSAPGEEIEENTVAEKIALLRANYRRWGRIDAGRRQIDISVFPDRFTTPVADSAENQW